MAKPAPKRPRAELDAYYTPDWPIRRFLHAVRDELDELLRRPGANFLEPCCGDGAILRALPAVLSITATQCAANDIDPREATKAKAYAVYTSHRDALTIRLGDEYFADVVITNPPYHANFPLRLVRHFMRQPNPPAFFAMLCRLTLLETPSRAAFFREFPPHVYVLPERISFTGDGQSDNAGSAWFVFRPGQTDGRLFWLTDDHLQPKLALDGDP